MARAVYYHPGNEAVCRDALDAAVAADPNTFTIGGRLVILRAPDPRAYGFESWGGDLPATTSALPADIVKRAESLAWMVKAGGNGGYKRAKPPRDFCTDYLTQLRARYAARPLVGFARVPYMKEDGTITNHVGYDPHTGLYHDRSPTWFFLTPPPMPMP
jgi:hypothetical protein